MLIDQRINQITIKWINEFKKLKGILSGLEALRKVEARVTERERRGKERGAEGAVVADVSILNLFLSGALFASSNNIKSIKKNNNN